MTLLKDPCEKCRKKGSCPPKCYPLLDYRRAVAKRNKQQNHETCVACGAVIPEGRQVCKQCSNRRKYERL